MIRRLIPRRQGDGIPAVGIDGEDSEALHECDALLPLLCLGLLRAVPLSGFYHLSPRVHHAPKTILPLKDGEGRDPIGIRIGLWLRLVAPWLASSSLRHRDSAAASCRGAQRLPHAERQGQAPPADRDVKGALGQTQRSGRALADSPPCTMTSCE